ncbi:MAG TPA: sugar phosphate isomerase/epimerase family protein [Bryobacteraceae bacterium]|jgi:sugar phosphate isomerase/epimerase|nr:sugar phosphate isomerase/epimerase family protein [Bryobacteraceae bacterium]
MNHVLSTHLVVNYRLTTVWLDKIWHAGIPAVELFCARQHLDYRDRAQIRELGHWFRDAELKVHSIHAPFFNDEVWGRSGPNAVLTITEPVKAKRIAMVDEIKWAIEIAEVIPFRYMVQHLGTPDEQYDERRLEAAFTSLEELSLFAKQRGVEIILENIPNGISNSSQLIQFLDTTHLKLGLCFDTGHANLMEGVEPAWQVMKERIRSLHVHDNDGKTDRHLFPLVSGGGTIDWRKVMPMLASRESQYPLLLELKEAPEIQKPLEAVKQCFERLEALTVEEYAR